MSDAILLGLISGMLFVAAWMRMGLAKKKKESMSAPWMVQGFLFPAALLIAAVLLQMETADLVIPVVVIGIAEEVFCHFYRKKQTRNTDET